MSLQTMIYNEKKWIFTAKLRDKARQNYKFSTPQVLARFFIVLPQIISTRESKLTPLCSVQVQKKKTQQQQT